MSVKIWGGVDLNFAHDNILKYRNICNNVYTCIMHADVKI